jgi:hypothetical protein
MALNDLSPEAIAALSDLVRDKKAKVLRLRAAEVILTRTLGSAEVTRVEVSTKESPLDKLTPHELVALIDSCTKRPALGAPSAEVVEAEVM